MEMIQLPCPARITIRSVRGKAAYGHIENKEGMVTNVYPTAGGTFCKFKTEGFNDFVDKADLTFLMKPQQQQEASPAKEEEAEYDGRYSPEADELVLHMLTNHALDMKDEARFTDLSSPAWRTHLYKEETV